MASSAPLGVMPGPTHLPWPEDTNLDMTGSWIWNWQPSEIQKMEDTSTNDPDPSREPFSLNDLDVSLLTTTANLDINDNSHRPTLRSQYPDVGLDLGLDPWTPNLGRIHDPDQDIPWAMPISFHDGSAQIQLYLDYGELLASLDIHRGPGAVGSGQGVHLSKGPVLHNVPVPTDENDSTQELPSTTVCPAAQEHSGPTLSFVSRGPGQCYPLVHNGYTSHKSSIPSKSNSVKEEQSAEAAPLGATDDRQIRTSNFQVGAGTRPAHAHSGESGATDLNFNVGEMFFDLDMHNVQPRRLRKKTTQEKESCLRVRRLGGACEKHKLAKKACRCPRGPDTSNSPSQSLDSSPPRKRQKRNTEQTQPRRQSLTVTPPKTPAAFDPLHDSHQADDSSPVTCPVRLLPSASVAAVASQADTKEMIDLSIVPNDTLIFACPYPLTGCRFLSLTYSEWSAHIDVHRRSAAIDNPDVPRTDN